MTNDLVTLKDTCSVADARRIMGEEHIRHLPIINEAGDLVGVLSQKDVLAAMVSVLADMDQNAIDTMEAAIPIRELMTTAMTTIQEDSRLRDAGLTLLELKLGCLPVLSNGRLVGILTETDFIKLAVYLLDQVDS
ncbi:MAG: CBS domain-containing protein [Pseudomonadota bacterium]